MHEQQKQDLAIKDLTKGEIYLYIWRPRKGLEIRLEYKGVQKSKKGPRHVFVNLDFGKEDAGEQIRGFGLHSRRLRRNLKKL